MTDQITPLPWVRSLKARDAVVAPEASITYPEEKQDYGGRVIFESCSKANQRHIIECVTLRPGFDQLEVAVKEACRATCDGVFCTDEEYQAGEACTTCALVGPRDCCRKCGIHLALDALEQARAAVKAQSTEIVVVT